MPDEAQGIHEQNMATLAGLSEVQRREALQEVQARLKPATLEFLQR